MFDGTRPVEHLQLPLAADFIEQCARRIVEEGQSRLPDLSEFLVVVPSPALAHPLRQALAAAAGRTLLLPRITTLARLASSADAGGQPDSQRQLVLYRQLRERGWFADSALWEICAELISLFDELNERAVGLPQDEEEFLARLERAYAARDSLPLRFEAEVVHRLWRAEAAGDPGRQATVAQVLAKLAAAAAAPLYLICEGAPGPIEAAFCEAWGARQPARAFMPVRACEAGPMMQALNRAWPPGGGIRAPALWSRAAMVRAEQRQSPLAGRLRIIAAAGLDEEAQVVAAEVRRCLAAGGRRVALIAFDRVAARRARALLERDGILLQDETGWTLSTSRAAALIDAWLEVIAADAYHRDLLDLLKSPYVFGDWPHEMRQAGVRQLEAGLARHNLACGLERFASAMEHEAGCGDALHLLQRIAKAQRDMPRGNRPPAEWLDGLERALNALGALAPLEGDAAGAVLLELLRMRRAELATVSARLTFGEWREWLNRELENAAFVDRCIDSPLVMTHLAATRLRRFDAAILIGADRDNLAPAAGHALFCNQAVRAELGLSLADEAISRLRDDLAGLIVSCGEVTATWQEMRGDEANPLCPELGLLSALHALAWGDDLMRKSGGKSHPSLYAAGTPMPLPSAPQRIPLAMSPSAYASLLACPYQYFARRVLGLDEVEGVREALEKRDYGEIVHRILRRFHAAHPQLSGVPDAVLADDMAALGRESFGPLIEENFLEHAWLSRWIEGIPGYIEWQKAREAHGWRHAGGELSRECALPLADGGELVLSGRLDRLDRRADGSETVLDYKTQDASRLKKRMAEPLEDVQLACYVLLQGEMVAEAAYVALEGKKPGEIPLPDPQQSAREQGKRLAGLIEALRAGAPLPAHGIDAVCERCEMRGLCRKDYHSPSPIPRPETGVDGRSPPAGDSGS